MNEESVPFESPLGRFSALAGLTALDERGNVPVRLGSDLSDTARMIGAVMSRKDLYLDPSGRVVYLERGEREEMTPNKFRSWLPDEGGVVVYRKCDKDDGSPIIETLTKDQAGFILESRVLRDYLRPLHGVESVRLPVLRDGGRLELLPPGYDSETGIYTAIDHLEYDEEMDIAAANGNVRRMFGGFPLTDERSWSVLIAGLLALYVRHLPGGSGLRPGFLFLGNKPGCGKSVLAKAIQYAVLGRAPTVKMKTGEQLDKELEALMIAGKRALFFDNVYGGLFSATIDALLTSEEQEGRAMGGHGTFRARNTALLIVSGNGLQANEDAARRFLVVDLFEAGLPAERVIEKAAIINDDLMKTPAWRSTILACCFAFVRNWVENGCPDGSLTFPTFERYSWTMGGIVEAAGFSNPFTPPDIPDALNPDEAEFRELLVQTMEEMGDAPERDFTLEDLARMARLRGVFESKVGTAADGRRLSIKEDRLSGSEAAFAVDRGLLDNSQRTKFSKKVRRFVGSQRKVDGKLVEFGTREQARKATFTVRLMI